ncbi:MAG: hypothetical protein HGA22_01670, partial [Clostridiales bacterium]|nr:hypothetical protein [Clostridiales bacterium]
PISISYLNFTESDLEWYRAELKAAGFTRQEVEDSEGYMKMTESKAYSVGFAIEGETLQLVAVVGTY